MQRYRGPFEDSGGEKGINCAGLYKVVHAPTNKLTSIALLYPQSQAYSLGRRSNLRHSAPVLVIANLVGHLYRTNAPGLVSYHWLGYHGSAILRLRPHFWPRQDPPTRAQRQPMEAQQPPQPIQVTPTSANTTTSMTLSIIARPPVARSPVPSQWNKYLHTGYTAHPEQTWII